MTYTIDSNKLGLFVKSSQESVKADASKQIGFACYQLTQLWYASRQVAWQNRDRKSIFWNALQAGELEQFKTNVPGIRNLSGDYENDKNSQFDYDKLNKYLWDSFDISWREAVPFIEDSDVKSLKDIKDAERALLRFVYENWGKKLLSSYEPTPQGLAEKCTFDYYINESEIKIKGIFTNDKREITISSEGVDNISIIQVKGEKSWSASIQMNQEQLNSKQALKISQMLELASRLNLNIKEFIANPEGFLGLESARDFNLKLQELKKVLIAMNKDHMAKANENKKAETPLTTQLVETVTPDTKNNTENKVQVAIKTTIKQSKKSKQQEAEEWLKNNPEYAEDNFDAELGLNTEQNEEC